MLKGKTVVLGVTGCIAAYKSCEIVSRLKKLEANVEVIMTSHALEFVQPLSFETLSNNRVVTDLFDRGFDYDVEHIALAKKADVFVVAPATANTIGKIANGIADDMLSTTILACTAPKLICPAMNTNMYESSQVQDNLTSLEKKGYIIMKPIEGRLACGDVGKGKMAEPMDIVDKIIDILMPQRDLENHRILITAGSTEENIDGVRFITNHSSGKMGIELAKNAKSRGADVTLIAGRLSVKIPKDIDKVFNVKTTQQMYDAVMDNYHDADVIVKAAAPSDYKVKNPTFHKIKSKDLVLEFEKNPDIAEAVGKLKGDRILVIFCAETDNLVENAKLKLEKKNADIVVANDVTKEGAGFNVDTNIATLITRNGEIEDYELMQKSELAAKIFDRVVKLLEK